MTTTQKRQRRRDLRGTYGRSFAASGTAVAIVAGALVTGCGSDEDPPKDINETQVSAKESAKDELRARLASVSKRLPEDEVLPSFQRLTNAMSAALDTGLSQEELLAEVLDSNARQWKRDGGIDDYLANEKALTEQAQAGHVLTGPAPSGQSDKPPRGAGGVRAKGVRAEEFAVPARSAKPKAKEPVAIFQNGVQNTEDEAQVSRALLQDAVKQKVSLAYNRSIREPAAVVGATQISAQTVKNQLPNQPGKGLTASSFDWAGRVAELQKAATEVANATASLVKQHYGSEEEIRKNSGYISADKQARDALNHGNPVILIAHSEGGYSGRLLKQTLDKEAQEARQQRGEPPGRSSVGLLVIAPPYGNVTAESLKADGTEYVLIKGDAITNNPGYQIKHTVKAKKPQPTGNTLLDAGEKHLISTYMRKGSPSRAQIIKAFNKIKKKLCNPASTGGQRGLSADQNCEVTAPPPPASPEGTAPGQSPGASPEGTAPAPGQSPGESPEGTAPGEQPGDQGSAPGEAPQPTAPGGSPDENTEQPPQEGQSPETQGQTGGTPEEPGHTPEQDQLPDHTPQ